MEQRAVPGNWGSDVQLLPVQLPSYEMGYGGTTPFYLEAFNLDFDYVDKDTGKRTYPRSFQVCRPTIKNAYEPPWVTVINPTMLSCEEFGMSSEWYQAPAYGVTGLIPSHIFIGGPIELNDPSPSEQADIDVVTWSTGTGDPLTIGGGYPTGGPYMDLRHTRFNAEFAVYRDGNLAIISPSNPLKVGDRLSFIGEDILKNDPSVDLQRDLEIELPDDWKSLDDRWHPRMKFRSSGIYRGAKFLRDDRGPMETRPSIGLRVADKFVFDDLRAAGDVSAFGHANSIPLEFPPYPEPRSTAEAKPGFRQKVWNVGSVVKGLGSRVKQNIKDKAGRATDKISNAKNRFNEITGNPLSRANRQKNASTNADGDPQVEEAKEQEPVGGGNDNIGQQDSNNLPAQKYQSPDLSLGQSAVRTNAMYKSFYDQD